MIIFHHSALYVTEINFYHKRGQTILLENRMLYGLKHSLAEIQKGNLTGQQTLMLDQSTIVYQVNQIDEEHILVKITCEMDENLSNSATYKYSVSQEKIIYWSRF
ncbi:competence type IV pilus minor pilin ComGG [Metabacillus idriensis]|uniref:competence type IV pilus minor pilin ComGG n=1 Tax=Metabacillus idriensis TaxID=324768 RepID=UPI001CD49022|nr:competence type IV pilus minor pilin ComGG [Metabacillus idriensis]